jgi:hypothetical protein
MPRPRKKKRRIQRLVIYIMITFTLWITFVQSDYRTTPYQALKEIEKYSYFQSKQLLRKVDLENGDVVVLTKGDKWYSLGYMRKYGILWKTLDATIGQEIDKKEFLSIKDIVFNVEDGSKVVICYGIVYDESITKISAVNGQEKKTLSLDKERHFVFVFVQGQEYTTITAFDSKEQLIYERGYH